MRFSRFILLIVVGLAFVAGMGVHKAMISSGISWRDVFGVSDSAAKVRNAIRNRQTSAQYVAVRDFFAEFPSAADVVIFGDSQIAFADWHLLLDIDAANRGIYGETTAGALLRVGSIIAGHPKCVATMLGTGDFAAGRSVESTSRDYLLILDRLAAAGSEVIVQSTLLTEPPYAFNQKVKELNTELRAACRSRSRCFFLDLDRIITPGSTIDGVHLKPNTYKKWAEELKPTIVSQCTTKQ
jgi:lysophospholipase L1-like esterase